MSQIKVPRVNIVDNPNGYVFAKGYVPFSADVWEIKEDGEFGDKIEGEAAFNFNLKRWIFIPNSKDYNPKSKYLFKYDRIVEGELIMPTKDSNDMCTNQVYATNVTTPVYSNTATTSTAFNASDFMDAMDKVWKIDTSELTFAINVVEEQRKKRWNCANGTTWCVYTIMAMAHPQIVRINVLVPDKVVEVTIYDGLEHVYKQVCKDPDVFNLKFALALAWAKYDDKYGRTGERYHLSGEGLESYAENLIYLFKEPNKEFDRAIKAYNGWLKEEAKKEAEEEERKAIIARRQAKNKKRKEKMRARKKAEEINTIAEAIKLSKKEDN